MLPEPRVEADFVARLKRRDPDAFEELVRESCGILLVVAKRFFPNDADANDAVQQAFLNAYRAIESFDGNSKVSTWLHRILVNACLSKIRTRSRRPEQNIEEMLPKFLRDGHRADVQDPWPVMAEEVFQRQEVQDVVRQAIDQLPESYRTVLLLRDIEELSTDETAEILKESVGTIKTRLHRARQALRELLDPFMRDYLP